MNIYFLSEFLRNPRECGQQAAGIKHLQLKIEVEARDLYVVSETRVYKGNDLGRMRRSLRNTGR